MRAKAGFGPSYRVRIKGAPEDYVAITDSVVMKRFVELEENGYRVSQHVDKDTNTEVLAIVYKGNTQVQVAYDTKESETSHLKRLLDAFDLFMMPADPKEH